MYVFALSFHIYACSQVLIAYTFHEWIMDLGTTKRVTRDRGGFDMFCEKNTRSDVFGVGSYQLK